MGACPSAASVAYGWVTGAPTSSKPDWDYDNVAFSDDDDDDLLDLDLPASSARLSKTGSRFGSPSPHGSDFDLRNDHFTDDRLRMDEDSHLEDSCDEASRFMEDRSGRISGESLSQAAATAAAVAKATNAVVNSQRQLIPAAASSQVGPSDKRAQIGSFVSSIFRRDSQQKSAGMLQFPVGEGQSRSGVQRKGNVGAVPLQSKGLTSTADLTSWIDDPRQLQDISYTYQDDDNEEDFDAFLESVRATTLTGTSRTTCSTPDTTEVGPMNNPGEAAVVQEGDSDTANDAVLIGEEKTNHSEDAVIVEENEVR